MKKIILFIIAVIIIFLVFFAQRYMEFKAQQKEIKNYNNEYETYLNRPILGTELTSCINSAVNYNEKNNVQKDSNGYYIENDTNSIKIQIKITDTDTIYDMETIYNGGMSNFVQYYNLIYFECTKIDYNSKGKVKFLLFEQKTN